MKYTITYEYDIHHQNPFGARATKDNGSNVAWERSGISYNDARAKLIKTLENIEKMPVKEEISINNNDTKFSFENTFSKEEIYLIGKYLVENGLWNRDSYNGRPYSSLSIRFPYDTELSSNGARVDAINKLIYK